MSVLAVRLSSYSYGSNWSNHCSSVPFLYRSVKPTNCVATLSGTVAPFAAVSARFCLISKSVVCNIASCIGGSRWHLANLSLKLWNVTPYEISIDVLSFLFIVTNFCLLLSLSRLSRIAVPSLWSAHWVRRVVASLSTRRSGFNSSSVYVVDSVTLRQGCLRVFRCSAASVIQSVLQVHCCVPDAVDNLNNWQFL